MSTDQEIKDLVAKLSPTDAEPASIEGLIESSPTLCSDLTPFLFDPVHHNAAQDLLTSILGQKPSLLSTAASSILNHILKLTPSDTFHISDSILKLIVNQMHNSTVSIATKSTHALQTLCAVRPPLVETILQLLQPIPTDSTIMIRYYTLITQIIPQIDMIEHADLFKPFMDGIKDDNDPLLQMSLLEILEGTRDELIHDWDGLDPVLLSMAGAGANGSGSLHPFCAGAALRLLAKGNVPAEKFHEVLIAFGRNMKGELEKIGFIDGMTTFCQKEQHLKMVLKEEELLSEWLSLRMGQSKLKVVVMNSVAKVLQSHVVSDELCLDLYRAIGEVNDVGGGANSTEVIMGYVKTQIVELRLGAYELLTAVAGTKKGSHLLMRYGGFFEFLCNRNLEVVKEGKELKFSLVQAVLNSEVKGLLADDAVKVLQQVVDGGPYHVTNTRDPMLL